MYGRGAVSAGARYSCGGFQVTDETPGRAKLIAALIKAQQQMSNVKFDSKNPHFGNNYASLAAVRDATLPALNANGLAITQTTMAAVNGDTPTLLLVTTLHHESGEEMISSYPLPWNLDKPQVMGSAITYARRYCWNAMIGVSAEDDDDDAERATPRKAVKDALGRTDTKTVDEAFPDGSISRAMRKPKDAPLGAKMMPERARFVRIAKAAIANDRLPAPSIADAESVHMLLAVLLDQPAAMFDPARMKAEDWTRAANKLAAQTDTPDPLDHVRQEYDANKAPA